MGFYDFVKKGISVKESKTEPRKDYESSSFKRLRNFNPAVDLYKEENAQRVEMYRPRTMDEAKQVAEKLIAGDAVLVNFHGTDEEDAQRLLDFIMGASYALGGEVSRIHEATFLVTVKGTEIMVED